jgi:purine-nucleoside phosphorylase
MMENLYDRVAESIEYIRSLVKTGADHAIVLGTGLGDYADSLTDQVEIPYKDIPNFPVSTVQSHTGKLIFGYKSGIPLVIMSGRFHYYEGYSAKELTFPVRVLKALGIKHLIITNAAGGINPHFAEGDIVIINDHINLMPDHPLRGANDDRLGLRFPDMLNAYDAEEIKKFQDIGKKANISIKNGVYLGLQGPSLETPAEYRMAHILGADLVGMSSVPEVIVARHEGMTVTAFSIVSNVCFPSSNISVTTVEDVIAVVNKSAVNLQKIFNKYFEKLFNDRTNHPS